MRRLRATQRYYRDVLGSCADKKVRRRARSLVAPTGEARDRQVFALWLEEVAAVADTTELPGIDWLQHTTRSRVAAELEMLRSRIPPAFSLFEEELDRCLSAPWQPTPGRFVELAADRTRLAAVQLSASLEAWQAQPSDKARHRVRIDSKHVRYLLEPIGEVVVDGGRLIAELRALQDLLGELQDTVVHSVAILADLHSDGAGTLVEPVRNALEGGPQDILPNHLNTRAVGLLAVARKIRSRRDSLSIELAGRLEDGRLAQLLASLRSVHLAG